MVPLLLLMMQVTKGLSHECQWWVNLVCPQVPFAGRREIDMPCGESLDIRVYLVGIENGIKVRIYGGEGGLGEREGGQKKMKRGKGRRDRGSRYLFRRGTEKA